jgi:hypothetical protein
MEQPQLKAGDEVVVRSAEEILATLDEAGMVGGLPFMPEMLAFCGQRFRVRGRAEKICDTIAYTGTMRLPEAVFLDDLRCSGSGHGGCEAECRVFWKESWLRKVPASTDASSPPRAASPVDPSARLVRLGVRTELVEGKTVETFRCQATELVRASEPDRLTDPKAYLRVLSAGNVGPAHFLRVMGRAVWLEFLYRVGKVPAPHLPKLDQVPATAPPLGLKVGEWVQVKSIEEIRETLTKHSKNRGLWYDREMNAFCGKVYQVKKRVTRIIDERNGLMINLKSDCIMLEAVTCSGEHSLGRWFCPRAIYPYWREAWLRRAAAPSGRVAGQCQSSAAGGPGEVA